MADAGANTGTFLTAKAREMTPRELLPLVYDELRKLAAEPKRRSGSPAPLASSELVPQPR